MLRYMSLGGCPLNNPLLSLVRRKLARSVHVEMGFRRTPFSLSSGGAVQLVEFMLGRLEIPRWVRGMCYGDPRHVPTATQSARHHDADVVLIEMSTPIEYVFDGFVLNQNRFREAIAGPLARYDDATRRLVSRWLREGVQKQNEEARVAASTALLGIIDADTEDAVNLRDVIARLHGRHVGEEAIFAGLKQVVETLNKPTAVVLHNFSYMPDGRPLSFPADFKANSSAAAGRLGLPCYDPAIVVNRHWNTSVMMADMRHYRRGFDEIVGDEFLRLAQVIEPALILGKDFEGRLAA